MSERIPAIRIPTRGLIVSSLLLTVAAALGCKTAEKPTSVSSYQNGNGPVATQRGQSPTIEPSNGGNGLENAGAYTLKIGEKAPDFALEPAWGGDKLSLDSIRGDRPMILYVTGVAHKDLKTYFCRQLELKEILGNQLNVVFVVYESEMQTPSSEFTFLLINDGFKRAYQAQTIPGQIIEDRHGNVLFMRRQIAVHTTESLGKSIVDAGNRVIEGNNLLPYDIDPSYRYLVASSQLKKDFSSATLGIMGSQDREMIFNLLDDFVNYTQRQEPGYVPLDMLNAAARRTMELYQEAVSQNDALRSQVYLEYLKKYASLAYYEVKRQVEASTLPANSWNYMSTNYDYTIARSWGTRSIYAENRICDIAILGPQ